MAYGFGVRFWPPDFVTIRQSYGGNSSTQPVANKRPAPAAPLVGTMLDDLPPAGSLDLM